MIIFYAVILHLIAHPGTFLHGSHQYPTEPDAGFAQTYLGHGLVRKLLCWAVVYDKLIFAITLFPTINEATAYDYPTLLKRGKKIFL